MTTQATPDWLKVGATVIEWTRGYGISESGTSAYVTTITKIGKRHVVLASGSRYNAQSRFRRVGGTWWGVTWYLSAPDDPRAVTALHTGHHGGPPVTTGRRDDPRDYDEDYDADRRPTRRECEADEARDERGAQS